MVNEINKPSSNDNAALRERLAASNRQLQEMQEEHLQLLQEMDVLRQRAQELTRLNARQQLARQEQNRNEPPAESVAPPTAPSENIEPKPEGPVQTESGDNPVLENAAAATDTPESVEENTEDNKEQASYLNEKLAELAKLKSQFSRVQNIISTTNLIEDHLKAKEAKMSEFKSQPGPSHVESKPTPVKTSETTDAPTVDTVSSEAASIPSTSTTATTANEELLESMLSMFTDFTSDLRGQAESLRAERDRIKMLKDELIRRKQQ